MRCSCCDHQLSDYESTRRYASTGEFADLCTPCSKEIGLPLVGRTDLLKEENDSEDNFDYEENDKV